MARLVFSKNIYEDSSLNQWKGESPCFRELRFFFHLEHLMPNILNYPILLEYDFDFEHGYDNEQESDQGIKPQKLNYQLKSGFLLSFEFASTLLHSLREFLQEFSFSESRLTLSKI
ncbi:pentatricopeptide repeat-containing protein isoform X1 [Gossypium australe]|uniref:Pentatricopeptide repeat-containing protein isoform X1 n=1 Tax=Gossypium australe TaxID=47621 RepID=A0A5B6W6S6_9ROSI|nr:pentatricopeptide repeat-containing protein isoform X1 [Gossypium australe]